MEASRLQSLAMMLSRGYYVRHWMMWQTHTGEGSKWLMAIGVKDFDGSPVDMGGEMEKSGFTEVEPGLWVIERTRADGSPYRGG